MDHEVAKTLGDLELKLAELERELSSIGPRGQPTEAQGTATTEQADATAAQERPPETTIGAPGMLIDEAIEHYGQVVPQPPIASQPPVDTHTQAAYTAPIEHDHSHGETEYARRAEDSAYDDTPPTIPAPVPSPPAFEERQSIDVADLVRFRDKLAHTMDELIDEYSQLLSLKPPAPPS